MHEGSVMGALPSATPLPGNAALHLCPYDYLKIVGGGTSYKFYAFLFLKLFNFFYAFINYDYFNLNITLFHYSNHQKLLNNFFSCDDTFKIVGRETKKMERKILKGKKIFKY